MKKLIMCLMLMNVFNYSAYSQKVKTFSSNTERGISVSSFEQLVVDGNFKLILVESEEPAIQVKGSLRFVQAFKISQYDKSLVLRSIYADEHFDNQVTVNVKNLKRLVIQEKSVINTKGILQSENLNILIDAECFMTIVNNGLIKVKSSEDFNLDITK